MAKANDHVFQVSLTEIAFTLVFIILLLLGWMVYNAEREKKDLEKTSATAADAASAAKALGQVKQDFIAEIGAAGVKNPEEVISNLVSPKNWIHERERLKQRIDDLDKQLSALAEIKAAMANVTEKRDAVEKQIQSALALQNAIKKRLHSTPEPPEAHTSPLVPESKNKPELNEKGLEKQVMAAIDFKAEVDKELRVSSGEATGKSPTAKSMVAAYRQSMDTEKNGTPVDVVKKENADLRGQVAFLKGRLEARGGRDYPPCWAEEKTGKVEFLFNIEIQDAGLLITPGWPAGRESDARTLPGIDLLLVESLHSLTDFNTRMGGIGRESKKNNCRHYVYVKNRVNQLGTFNRYRFGIESFFYKLELKS